MKVAILGTRGIPNNYGGFEQFAEYLSLGLTKKGHEVYVYNSHNHLYKESDWKGIQIIHKYDPENKIGTAGQFIYDLNCIVDTHRHHFDVILNLGYTSSSVWGKLFPKKSIVITNMDGMEWKRTKYSNKVQKFLMYAEKLAVKYSNILISDSVGIQNYISSKYGVNSNFIAYGANLFKIPSLTSLSGFNIKPFEYNMLMARMEPENNIELILDGMQMSDTPYPFIVVGNHHNKFGKYLSEKYKDNSKIIFLGPIYNIDVINNLRYYSNIYFHGHSVGGTNPSLLEAMASNALIAAHDNEFNQHILNKDAFYFSNSMDVKAILDKHKSKNEHGHFIKNNLDRIETLYSWENIINQYEKLMLDSLESNKKGRVQK